ncbi:hypothetical protein ElyMa_005518200 [Elysia marginata]|uniref:Uncharacterized protein n=1 Tax=Elysia marginata TaxID=1093978 RepID=A0AAV4EVZ5_9GAST|nr:hypothetical protein ElyMa_005518200 [Elysia marginata]
MDSREEVLCFSTIMRPLIQQTLHNNGCSATVEKFFLILPTVQTSHPLTFFLSEPLKCHFGGMAFRQKVTSSMNLGIGLHILTLISFEWVSIR